MSESQTEPTSNPTSSASSLKPSQSISQDQIAPVVVETTNVISSTQQVTSNVVQQQTKTYNNNINEKDHGTDENVSSPFNDKNRQQTKQKIF